MSTKFMNFLAMVWFLSVLISLIVEGSMMGTVENRVINDLSIISSIKVGGLVPIPTFNIYFFRGVYRLLTFDYAFYVGSWQVVRWFWMCILSPGAVWGIGQTFAPVFANFLRIFR